MMPKILFFIIYLISLRVSAIETLPAELRTNGAELHKLLGIPTAALQKSSAVIYKEKREIAYGTVVSSDGLILTKKSEVPDLTNVTIRIDTSEYKEVTQVASDDVWDVVLLKINAATQPVVFAIGEPDIGTWCVSNGATERRSRRPMLGIISANSREISSSGGVVLGIEIVEEKNQIKLGKVFEKSGAADAGLKEGDIILKLNDGIISKRKDLMDALSNKKPGDKIELTYLRNKKENIAKVELKGRADIFEEQKSRNDAMSGDYSTKRSGFPRVLQHDIIGTSSTVGGPLLNLEGMCYGMNIARANRTESFTIPAKELQELLKRMQEVK